MPALTDDVHGVLQELLGLYGAGQPADRVSAALSQSAATELSRLSGFGAQGYGGKLGNHRTVLETQHGRDGIVGKTVTESGTGTLNGRGILTTQISDLQTRIQAITAVGDTRFSGPALLDSAQQTIANATRQVNADIDAARRRAAQAADGALGLPYIWGGGGAGGPSGGGFDCSGLTQYAIAQATDGEVVLPRTTYEQIYAGERIDPRDVRAGDLVFPAGSFSARGPEHVQLAAGNGMVIEAPYSGATVTYSPMPPDAVVIRVV